MPIRFVRLVVRVSLCCLLCLSWVGAGGEVLAQGTTAFTYQGRLTDGANPANGPFDLQFTLFDLASGGTQQGSTVVRPNVTVTNGVFTVQLDFGSVPFTTDNGTRYLEIGVRPGGSAGVFTILTPRQQVTPTPYAIKSQAADTATNATQLGGQPAGNYVQTNDSRLTDARNPLPGSTNYIQNGTTPQASSNFNISGTGTANIFTAATQYNIGGNRMVSIPGTENTFIGLNAGINNVNLPLSGVRNTFVGRSAGRDNTSGNENAFFGTNAGASNLTGLSNSFFGFSAGANNTTGSFNAFFGWNAGQNNAANSNSFFGNSAGRQNSTGTRNSIFGTDSGAVTTTGSNNSFFGTTAGFANTTGGSNTFVGANAGDDNTTGSSNTFIGYNSGSGTVVDLNFATAIGAEAQVTTSNTVVLGRAADTVQIPGNLNVVGTFNFNLPPGNANYIQNTTTQQASSNFNISGTGTVNTLNATTSNVSGTGTANIFNAVTQYNIGGNRVLSTSGSANTFVGDSAGLGNTTGVDNTVVGANTLPNNSTGGRNTVVGSGGGFSNTTGSNNTFIGFNAGSGVIADLNFATAIGSDAQASQNNTIILGRTGGLDSVGINTTTPTERLQVNGNVRATAFIQSSDARYKTDIQTIQDALAAVLKLRGVTFEWRKDMHLDAAAGRQVGFIAQEVEAVLPEVVTTANDGYKSVSYSNVVPLLVEAIKDQQKQIEALKSVEAENAALKARLAAIEERLGKIERSSFPDKK